MTQKGGIVMQSKFEKHQQMVTVKSQGGRFRWISVTALLLAIGGILHLITPSIGGLTLNWTIAMYCLAIILVKPSISQALGIGLVSALLTIPSSKSLFPYANLISEPMGALACILLVKIPIQIKIAKISLKPALCGFISTIISGFTFVTILKFVLALPLEVYLYGMLPVVVGVGATNAVITQLLYYPADKLFSLKVKANGHN